MKIKYQMCATKGIVPIFKGCSFDTSELPEAESMEIEFIIKASGLLDTDVLEVPQVTHGPNQQWSQWSLVVDDGQSEHFVGSSQRHGKLSSSEGFRHLTRLLSILNGHSVPQEPGT